MNHFSAITKGQLYRLGLLMTIIFSLSTLTSCDEDDDDGYLYYNIVGTWQQVAPYYGPIYQFDGNGQGACFDDYNGDSYFYWDVDNNYMTLDFGGGYYEDYNWSMQGNSLYLYPLDDYSNPLVLQPY